ncbi:MAG: tetratricopeptide repeat protein [Lachnospiraceae bacterium]|nr:tetratricopeptide repeat protein [Lachnospiraceae bacterium]
MNCFYCQNEIGEQSSCPYCGADNSAYRKVIHASNIFYNEGLERAKIRDLTGAAEYLNQSLKYYKYNMDARNLLGLVYFEMGETVQALSEWVISKNYFPENNPIADHYMDDLQHGANMLEKLNQTTKKYNQAIEYVRQKSYDLAKIQLKRVLSMQSNMIRARQLLALLLMMEGKYADAKKELSEAAKIDIKNPTTIAYQQEVRRVLKDKKSNKKKKRRDESLDYVNNADGYTPRQTFIEAMDNSKSGIVNILVGIIIGVLVCMFLVVPTIRQNANSDAASALVDANEKASSTATDVAVLQREIDSLNEELDKYTGKGDQKQSYEKLLEAQTARTTGDMEAACTAMETINRDLLSANGQALYDEIIAQTNVYQCDKYYREGYTAFYKQEFQQAVDAFAKVVAIDEAYSNGDAINYLAQSYAAVEDNENALTYYKKIVETYPNTRKARAAERAIETLESGGKLDIANSSTGGAAPAATTEEVVETPAVEEAVPAE